MSDEQWLRDGLASAVPEPPTSPDRARAAENLARRRRRTTALAVVGTVAAVAAAAVLTATLSSGGDGTTPVDTASDGPAVPVECPPIKIEKGGTAEESELDRPDPTAPDAVPDGATSARLCQGPGTVFPVPDDALVTGVDDLVTAVNELETTGPPEVCTLELGPGYRIAFGYDDGSTFVASGRLYGCQTLVVGSGYRADPQAAQDKFLELLEAQEQANGDEPDEADAEAPSCADAATVPSPAVERITSAILCLDGSGGSVSTPIDPADLDLLLGDIATHQTTETLRCAAAPPHPFIVGADASGARVTIPSECATSWWRLPNGRAWAPSEEAVAILDRLLSEAR